MQQVKIAPHFSSQTYETLLYPLFSSYYTFIVFTGSENYFAISHILIVIQWAHMILVTKNSLGQNHNCVVQFTLTLSAFINESSFLLHK